MPGRDIYGDLGWTVTWEGALSAFLGSRIRAEPEHRTPGDSRPELGKKNADGDEGLPNFTSWLLRLPGARGHRGGVGRVGVISETQELGAEVVARQ